jgi:hypothetical protein
LLQKTVCIALALSISLPTVTQSGSKEILLAQELMEPQIQPIRQFQTPLIMLTPPDPSSQATAHSRTMLGHTAPYKNCIKKHPIASNQFSILIGGFFGQVEISLFIIDIEIKL